MSIIEINGVDLPAPSLINISQSDIKNIGTNELGQDQIDIVRTGIYHVSLGFTELNNSNLHLILSSLDGLVHNVKLPTSGGFKIKKMRVDGEIDMDMVDGGNGKVAWNLNFNLKEI